MPIATRTVLRAILPLAVALNGQRARPGVGEACASGSNDRQNPCRA